jgi:hypothetical protein
MEQLDIDTCAHWIFYANCSAEQAAGIRAQLFHDAASGTIKMKLLICLVFTWFTPGFRHNFAQIKTNLQQKN